VARFVKRRLGMEPDNADRMQWLLEHRHSCRAPFDPAQRVTEHELERIVAAARWAPTAHNMQNFRLVAVDDRRILDELGRIRALVSPTFIAENYRQLSWSEDELRRRKTGILGTSFPASWRTDDPAKIPSHDARLLGESIAGAPLVIVVVFDPTQRAPASEGDMLGMISLGCVLENMWIAAHAQRLDVQVVSAFAAVDAEPAVKRLLAVPEPWRIAFALRIGHALSAKPALRVRREPALFTGRNRFA